MMAVKSTYPYRLCRWVATTQFLEGFQDTEYPWAFCGLLDGDGFPPS